MVAKAGGMTSCMQHTIIAAVAADLRVFAGGVYNSPYSNCYVERRNFLVWQMLKVITCDVYKPKNAMQIYRILLRLTFSA